MNSEAMKELQIRAAEIKTRYAKCSSNYEKRAAYSDCELLLLDIQDLAVDSVLGMNNGTFVNHIDERNEETHNSDDKNGRNAEGKVVNPELLELEASVTKASAEMTLGYAQREAPRNPALKIVFKFYDLIDQGCRLIAVWMFLISSATLLALPCIALNPLSLYLVERGLIAPKYQFTNLAKVFIGNTIITLSGIHLETGGYRDSDFGKECVLTCFSHGSSMDAFIIAAIIPVRHLTPSKSELFLIPFFSWLLYAFGGVPVNRKNRTQAVRAIGATASSARKGDCIVIAPEGTRSKTGQLLPFKKGPSHLWEQLQTPTIPLLIFGAFDLYPPGRQMSLAGKVFVQFLTPIQPHEAKTRDEFLRVLRRRMLEGLKAGPKDVARELTWGERLYTVSAVVALYVSHFYAAMYFHHVLFAYTGWSIMQMITRILGVAMTFTIFLYVHLMYLSPILEKFSSAGTKSKKQ